MTNQSIHWQPAPALKPYILDIFGFDSYVENPQRMRRYPMPFIVVMINLGPTIRLYQEDVLEIKHADGFVAGLGETYIDIQSSQNISGIQISLTPTGAYRLFKIPMSKLRGKAISLHDILPLSHQDFIEQLVSTTNWEGRFKTVESYLMRNLFRLSYNTKIIDWALSEISSSHGLINIGELTHTLGYSRKHIISLFHEHVGVPPKLIARLIRLNHIMQSIASVQNCNWADLAQTFGFHDQAHFIKEVKHFNGLTPSQARLNFYGMKNLLR